MKKNSNNKHIIAIIPARSGSKGLVDKNIISLCGKPLLAYSIEAAKQTKLFDVIHVSTDSKVYLEISSQFGADEPFLRSSENSRDESSTWDTVREVLTMYSRIGKEFDYCVVLQPTSPLRGAKDINEAWELFMNKKARSLTSVTEVDHPVQWCFRFETETCSMKEYEKSPFRNYRRQELEKYYRENGAIYISRVEDVMDECFDFYSDRCIGYVMDRENSIDIDTIQDYYTAEAVMRLKEREQ